MLNKLDKTIESLILIETILAEVARHPEYEGPEKEDEERTGMRSFDTEGEEEEEEEEEEKETTVSNPPEVGDRHPPPIDPTASHPSIALDNPEDITGNGLSSEDAAREKVAKDFTSGESTTSIQKTLHRFSGQHGATVGGVLTKLQKAGLMLPRSKFTAPPRRGYVPTTPAVDSSQLSLQDRFASVRAGAPAQKLLKPEEHADYLKWMEQQDSTES